LWHPAKLWGGRYAGLLGVSSQGIGQAF